MITIDKDTKTPTWVITKTDSEGYHRQLTLTEGEVRELAAILPDAEADACGDLEDEVMKYWNDHALEYRLGRVSDLDFLHLCARHFAEWGAEHLKK